MVDRFNALATHNEVEFEAWFNDRIEPGRSWNVNERAWKFRYRYLPSFSIFGRKFRWPTPMWDRKPDLLVCLYAEPVFVGGTMVAWLRRVPVAYWCEVTFDRWVRRSWWKNRLKKIVFRKAVATLGAGEDGRQFAIRCGAPNERAMILPHVVDVESYARGAAQATLHRAELRVQWRLAGTVFVYVGRLWWGKGLPSLLAAFGEVQQRSLREVSLLLVGDGPDETALREACTERGLRNVVFAGFHQKAELPRFYAMADVFVFPTLGDPYGLVVDEAMACGLPVISTSAAGEISARIDDDVNGFIVPPEDSTALARCMLRLAGDAELRGRMGKLCAQKMAGRTPAWWADEFVKIVARLLPGAQGVGAPNRGS